MKYKITLNLNKWIKLQSFRELEKNIEVLNLYTSISAQETKQKCKERRFDNFNLFNVV